MKIGYIVRARAYDINTDKYVIKDFSEIFFTEKEAEERLELLEKHYSEEYFLFYINKVNLSLVGELKIK